jgi:hypothetical protein
MNNIEKSSANIAALLVLTKMIKQKELNVNDALGLVINVMTIINQSKAKIDDDTTIGTTKDFICEVAKGPDGLLGTHDDIVPPKTLQEIEELLQTSIADDVLSMCNELVKHRRFDTKRAVFCMSKLCMKS